MQQLTYNLTDDDYIAFNQQVARSDPALVARALRIRMVGSVAMALAVAVGLRIVQSDTVVTLVGTLLALAVMWFSWPLVQRWSTAAQLKRVAATSGLGRTGATTLVWDDRQVTEAAPATRASVTWDQLDRVAETPTHVFLFFGPHEGLIVPKRAGDGVTDLTRFARERNVTR